MSHPHPRNLEICYLAWQKTGFAHEIKLQILICGDYLGSSGWALSTITGVLTKGRQDCLSQQGGYDKGGTVTVGRTRSQEVNQDVWLLPGARRQVMSISGRNAAVLTHFRLLISGNAGARSCVASSPWICGDLLQQPRKLVHSEQGRWGILCCLI